ncbi:MAG: enoyl-CoA hydratase/isomerase family protein [Burkholderiaceae bacterium]
MDESILIERDGAVAEIVLNRPERRNALTEPMRIALNQAVRSVSADDSVSVIVLRGAGGAFCSGIDLKALNESGPDPAARQAWADLQVALYESEKIIIGALERFAINAGGPLVFGCDHLIVGENAFLQIGEIQQGVSPAMNLAWLLLKHGDALARRITLRGDRIDAASLLRMGIASEVVADDQVVARARAWAQELAAYPAAAAAGIKRTIRGLNRVEDPQAWFDKAMSLFPFAPVAGTPRVR